MDTLKGKQIMVWTIRFRVDVDIQRSGGLPQVEEDDRLLLKVYRPVLMGGTFVAYFSRTTAKIVPENFSSERLKSVTVRVCITDCTGDFYFREPYKLSHPVSTSVPRDAPPTPLPPAKPVADCVPC